MALLAMYRINNNGLYLNDYLDNLFKKNKITTFSSTNEEINGFNIFLSNYNKSLELVRLANKIF